MLFCQSVRIFFIPRRVLRIFYIAGLITKFLGQNGTRSARCHFRAPKSLQFQGPPLPSNDPRNHFVPRHVHNRKEKRGGLTVVTFDRSCFKLFSRKFSTNVVQAPVRGLKLLREPWFYYLQTIIVFQYRHSVGQRHTFHIIHLIETTVLYILPDIWDDGKNRLIFINLFK